MTLKLASSYLLLLLSLLLPSVVGSQVESESDAKRTLLRYLEAQRQGDTHTMRSLMAGHLLEEQDPLLSNPSYPAYLGENFAYAEFSIDWVKEPRPATILIQTSFTYRPGDTIVRHYVMRKIDKNGLEIENFLIHEDYDPDFR